MGCMGTGVGGSGRRVLGGGWERGEEEEEECEEEAERKCLTLPT